MQKHDFDATEQLMPDDYAYEHFDLNNKELTYAVDDSNLNCRLNGALYLVQVDRDGDAGSEFGMGS